MSSLPLMEWNGKPPLPWDWDNLIMFHGTSESPKKLRATDWEFDGENVDSGSFNSSGGGTGSGNGNGSGSGGSLSDLGLTSLSKSSKSASINSSSIGEVKASKFTLEATEAIPEDFNPTKEFTKARATVTTGTSSTPEVSVGSGEPLLSLKLGKRTYFEDVCAGGNARTSPFSVVPASSITSAKRSKSSGQNTPAPCCQVEGCTLDLSSAKDYHRKHRVCESHSKSPKVVIAGLERRFCQQCSRFHELSEFDEKKRSCRRRLSDHNARRRKPQPGSVHLNPPRLSSSLYDGRQQMSFIWNGALPVHARGYTNLTWESTSSSKMTVTKECVMKPEKIGGIDGKLHLPGNHLTNSIPMDRHHSNDLLQSKVKGTPAEILNQGLEECVISSNEDATPDIRRALSLLSTSSWGSCEPKCVTLEQAMHTNHTSVSSSMLHRIPQGLPLSSSDYWRTEQQSADSHVNNLTSQSDGNSFFHEFQLLRAPYESDFYSSQMN